MSQNKQQNNREIVSVAVITYHSASTVLETLDSIINQTYGAENIELIISDDGSKDNTVQVISKWLSKHQNYFYDVKFFANQVNCGVSRNCNIAWKAATSEWIKTIAGDDILLPNCILDNKEFITQNVDAHIVMSKMKLFYDQENKSYKSRELSGFEISFFNSSSEKQHIYLQSNDLSGAPSVFISKRLLSDVEYANEEFTMMEDYPLWYKCTGMGYKIFFMNKETVIYRIGESITRSGCKLANLNHLKQVIIFDSNFIVKDAKVTLSRVRRLIHINLLYKLCKICNKRTFLTKLAYFCILLVKPNYISHRLNSFKKSLSNGLF